MGWVALFLAGAVGGALCDQIHVQAGVLAYPHPFVLDQAWWVAPQFGVALFVILGGARLFAQRSRARSRVAVDAALFVGAYGATGMFNRWPAALTVALVAVWLVRLGVDEDRGVLLVFSLLLALGGTTYEGALASTGAFHYTHPDVFHVPVWLAGIYLDGAPLALDVARSLSGREKGGPLQARPSGTSLSQ
ncbi:MAG: DUF2878 family protein [Actinobacteria bacterium]|nr:DUF2878 family protein [Actinomycetota bacterium]